MPVGRRGWIINPCDLTEELIFRLQSAGINELGIHPGGGQRAAEKLSSCLDWLEEDETERLLELARERGLSLELCEHGASFLLPRSGFENHPERFRQDESGARTPFGNLCASNPEALETVSDSAEKLYKRLRGQFDRVTLWPDDITKGGCRCGECLKLSVADQALKITNAIVRGFRRVDPSAKCGFLAYQDALETPKRVSPEQGVYLEYAPIRRDSLLPINDPANSGETKHLKELLEFFGVQNARVIEYWVDNSRFSDWTRPPKKLVFLSNVMRQDVKYYLSLGFEDLTSFACFLGPDYISLYGLPPYEEYGKAFAEAAACSLP